MWDLLISPLDGWFATALCLIGALVVDVAYNYAAVSLIWVLRPQAVNPASNDRKLDMLPRNPMVALLVMVVWVGAEEVLYRLPLAFFVHEGYGPMALLAYAALFSITHWERGLAWYVPFLLHGVGALFYGVLFLKMGGAHHQEARGLLFVTALHLAYNLVPWLLVKLRRRIAGDEDASAQDAAEESTT